MRHCMRYHNAYRDIVCDIISQYRVRYLYAISHVISYAISHAILYAISLCDIALDIVCYIVCVIVVRYRYTISYCYIGYDIVCYIFMQLHYSRCNFHVHNRNAWKSCRMANHADCHHSEWQNGRMVSSIVIMMPSSLWSSSLCSSCWAPGPAYI